MWNWRTTIFSPARKPSAGSLDATGDAPSTSWNRDCCQRSSSATVGSHGNPDSCSTCSSSKTGRRREVVPVAVEGRNDGGSAAALEYVLSQAGADISQSNGSPLVRQLPR